MTNREIRRWYVAQVRIIPEQSEAWTREGIPAEVRARRAFEIRRRARREARDMMLDPKDVETLQRRDQANYGNPDGPTFEQLVEALGKTFSGDALYEELIAQAARTDAETNKRFGLSRQTPESKREL